jgi:hypothetical protein
MGGIEYKMSSHIPPKIPPKSREYDSNTNVPGLDDQLDPGQVGFGIDN